MTLIAMQGGGAEADDDEHSLHLRDVVSFASIHSIGTHTEHTIVASY
jgi:hypothetical protein